MLKEHLWTAAYIWFRIETLSNIYHYFFAKIVNDYTILCVKSVRIRSCSGPFFPAIVLNRERYFVSLLIQFEEILGISPYSVQMRENADHNNFE